MPLFAQADCCTVFVIMAVAAGIVGGIKLLWEYHMMTNHPQIYIHQKLMEEERKARKQRMAAGIGLNLLRLFLGGK